MQTNRHPPANILESKIAAAPNALALSVVEFAKAIGVSKGTVYNMLKDGELKSTTVRGRRIIPASEAHRIVNQAA